MGVIWRRSTCLAKCTPKSEHKNIQYISEPTCYLAVQVQYRAITWEQLKMGKWWQMYIFECDLDVDYSGVFIYSWPYEPCFCMMQAKIQWSVHIHTRCMILNVQGLIAHSMFLEQKAKYAKVCEVQMMVTTGNPNDCNFHISLHTGPLPNYPTSTFTQGEFMTTVAPVSWTSHHCLLQEATLRSAALIGVTDLCPSQHFLDASKIRPSIFGMDRKQIKVGSGIPLRWTGNA